MHATPRRSNGSKGAARLPVYRRWWFWIGLTLAVLLMLSLAINLPDHATDAPRSALPEVSR